ncbi:hypothetical protein HZS61_008726 [Fusarium oxysporum f. sp. conglutinans]|uniref:ATP-dependent DNA helicase n=2 Tax=Fusarium oxysporum f. sp. conglutinans TaxID=100902 RepID=A0A8H6LQ90_FUSOX|nr:hypothetical protein HZS61_008726 [Fusarium oxysporum f. sp. conglutinans]
MLSVTRKNFPEVERTVRSLTAERLELAKTELETVGRTGDEDVKQLLKSLSLYGFRQPMSRESRLSMRRKIKSDIIRDGIPAIWFTLNPNDITNPVKLRLAAYRTRDPDEAEAFLTSLDLAYKRTRLAISDPLSSAVFFHREVSMFFKHYVKTGKESVFGRISRYFGAVETNERGALHVHGLLWLQGNMHLSSILRDVEEEGKAAYRERVTQYVDSVFTEDLDQEASSAVQAERSVTSDISSLLENSQQFAAAFDEEANFCAGATQIHTHSPTCVKYAIRGRGKLRDPCRFKAPWRLAERTAFTDEGVLQIRRTHSMVNRWNKAMAVGLRHNHDISFIATQCKTMAIVFYVTNYATKVEDPVWKRVAAATELFPATDESIVGNSKASEADRGQNQTRQFLMKVANRIFTERALSQVEVVAHLLGYPTEFASNDAWTFLNVSSLYWHIFRLWRHLRRESGMEVVDEPLEETVFLEEGGGRISLVQAYPHRGKLLEGLSLYDYMSIVRLKRKGKGAGTWGEVQFDRSWHRSQTWVQALRRPGEHAVVCFDGYLSTDWSDETEGYYQRAAVQHLALFVPWESFLSEGAGDINAIWERQKRALPRRISFAVDNIQLLHRSAEDAKRDARQWAAQSGDGDGDPGVDTARSECDTEPQTAYRSDCVGTATRLLDVLRQAMARTEITAGSKEIWTIAQQLSQFQQSALRSTEELHGIIVSERGLRTMSRAEKSSAGADVAWQEHVKCIKSQQTSASREKEKMIQGIQNQLDSNTAGHEPTVYNMLNGFGEHEIRLTATDAETLGRCVRPSTTIQFGPSTSFSEVGRQLSRPFTLNRKQGIALWLICRQLDRVRRDESGTPQLCQFIGGEGGTGKSRIIAAITELFASKGISHRLLVTATSGTAAANIDGVTIHSACGFSKDTAPRGGRGSDVDGFAASSSASLRVDGRSTAQWQEKWLLIIDEVSMLGARTLYVVNEQLRKLRGRAQDFGGIPIILFCGDFHQFRPVQERSILLPSTAISWDEEKTFKAEQRYQHDRAHALWNKFTTVIMLDEQVRAASDPQLQRLLTRVRHGVQDRSDMDLLNRTCYKENRRIVWESGLTVVTPLNRNRWNLNIEASLCFRKERQSQLRIFVSEHRWKEGEPTEEEAVMMLSQGDDSAVPVPAIFMFVPGMPVVVNKNTHQGLKLVNGASYMALDVIVDKAHPGYRVNEETILHFGPPAGIVLASETTRDFHFVGMPAGTILLTPNSSARHRGRPPLGVKTNKGDIEEMRRRLRGHANHHPSTKCPQLCKSDIPKARKWLHRTRIDTEHTNPNESGTVNDQSDDEGGDSDATETDSKIADVIVALGLPEDQIKENTDEDEDENEEEEDEEEVKDLEDENDLDWAAPKKQSPKKQSPPRERRRSTAREIVEIEDDETDEETVVDPAGDGFIVNDSPEPVHPNGQSGPDRGTSTPNSAPVTSTRPRRSIQQPSQLGSDTPRSSVRQSNGSAEYTSATLAVMNPPGSQQPTPTASPAKTTQNFVKPRPQSHAAVPRSPIPGTRSAKQLQQANSQPSASTSASNSHSSATPRKQSSSRPLASPPTSATSQNTQQQSGSWSSASNPVAPQWAYTQSTNSQRSTPHHLAQSRGDKRPAELSPAASYVNNTPTKASRSGAKRQRTSNALPHQSQVPRAINWDAVSPSGDEFKETLKDVSDAIKLGVHNFEELLAEINGEQRRLSAVQSSLFHKKNDYTNDQMKAQVALKDVEESTANENTTLRSLEEVYQKNPGDAELRNFINKRKQTILEHKEVYVIVKSQHDKSIAGRYKIDHEIAFVTKRLGQLDAERADVLREKEGFDKAAQCLETMDRIMTVGWPNEVDMLKAWPNVVDMLENYGVLSKKDIS